MPKATVQAAVGGTALDMVVELKLTDTAMARAQLVLMLSVLVILITAPIGAIGISVFGPKYLVKDMMAREDSCDAFPSTSAPSTPQKNVGSDGSKSEGLAAKDAAAYAR